MTEKMSERQNRTDSRNTERRENEKEIEICEAKYKLRLKETENNPKTERYPMERPTTVLVHLSRQEKR